MRYIVGWGLAASFLFIMWVGSQINSLVNYQQVTAIVSHIEDKCYLERTSRGVVAKTRERTDYLDCSKAEALVKSDAQLDGSEIIRKTSIKVAYISPADNNQHTAWVSEMGSANAYVGLARGDEVMINAHTDEPEKVESL